MSALMTSSVEVAENVDRAAPNDKQGSIADDRRGREIVGNLLANVVDVNG